MDVKLVLKNLWVLPYIGGAVVVFAIMFPAGIHIIPNLTEYSHTTWVWGLVCTIDFQQIGDWTWWTEFGFILDPLILTVSIALSVIIIYYGVKSVLRARNLNKEDKNLDKSSMIYGVIILALITFWIFLVEFYYSITGFPVNSYFDSFGIGPPFSFWGYFEMSFGIIGVLLGASLPIIGYLVSLFLTRKYDYLLFDDDEEEEDVEKKSPQITPKPLPTTKPLPNRQQPRTPQ